MLPLLLALGTLAAPSQAEAGTQPDVVRVRVSGALDIGTQGLLERAVRRAKAADAPMVVELDTPGGEIELMWTLASAIDDASSEGVRTVAWVRDRALSAGALLAIACDEVYVRAQATMGAAAPVTFDPSQGTVAIPDELVREKVTSAVKKSFRGFAEKHGRPALLAEAMVDAEMGVREVLVDGVPRLVSQSEYDDLRMAGADYELVRTLVEPGRLCSLSGREAVELHMADGIVDDWDELTELLGVGRVTAQVERSKSEDLAAFLAGIRYILLGIGMVALFSEIKTPGFGFPGIVAIVAFAVVLFGQYLVGVAEIPHVLAVAAGAALIAVELFVAPGTLWFGISGAVLVVGGLLFALGGAELGFAYALDRQIAVDRLFASAVWLLVAVLGTWALGALLPRTPMAGPLVLNAAGAPGHGEGVREVVSVTEKERLIGRTGLALTDLRPVGKVTLDGLGDDALEVRAEGEAIDAGARVRVVDVTSGRLVVGPAGEEGA